MNESSPAGLEFLVNEGKRMLTHAGFIKYFKNTSWLLLARFVGLAVSFFVVGYVARYLGPTYYGTLSYAQSFVSILSVLASLGIDQILYRDIVAHPDRENELLGTAFYLKLAFGIAAFAITIIAGFISKADHLTIILIAIIASTFLLAPASVVSHYLNGKVISKYNSIITIFLALFLPAVKIVLVWRGAPLTYFAGVFLLEALISTVFYIWVYRHISGRSFSSWVYKKTAAIELLRDGAPLMLASLFGYIYGRIDQVMLGQMLGVSSVGIYDAAVRISEVWYFLPGLIIGSLFPAIVNARKTSRAAYYRRLRALFFLILAISVSVSVAIFFIASPLMRLVFGAQYLGSINVVRIYVWAGIGMAVGTIAQQYLIAENFGSYFFYISFGTAGINVLLNLILIPIYGPSGAAIATLVSYTAIPFMLLLFKNTRTDIVEIFRKSA
jgi:O-antigen/teichoic acid export membrane protein